MEVYPTFTIRVNYIDMDVIAIHIMPALQKLGLERMWMAFGPEISSKCFPVHEIGSQIGPEKTRGMTFSMRRMAIFFLRSDQRKGVSLANVLATLAV
jgi:hypothetical protein